MTRLRNDKSLQDHHERDCDQQHEPSNPHANLDPRTIGMRRSSHGVTPPPGRALVGDLLRKCREMPRSPKLEFREGLSDELWRLVADAVMLTRTAAFPE
jgi:hypothetical protein